MYSSLSVGLHLRIEFPCPALKYDFSLLREYAHYTQQIMLELILLQLIALGYLPLSKTIIHRGMGDPTVVCVEDQQSPFYVVNEVTLTGQTLSLGFC